MNVQFFREFVLFSIVGLVYITFSKTSEAALALDKMNGSQMPGKDRRLKVS